MEERNTENLTTKDECERTEQGNALPVFALFGCVLVGLTYVILSGTQDILAGTNKPSTTILLAGVIPIFVVDIAVPYFINRIPKVILVCTACITTSGGLIILAFADVEWKIAAVTLSVFGVAVGTIIVVSLTAFFHPLALSWYSSGTGAGFLMGPLFYTSLTTWLCVSPKITLTIASAMPLAVYFVLYYFINKNIRGKATDPADEEIVYTKIEDTDSEDVEDGEINKQRGKITQDKDRRTRKIGDDAKSLTRQQKMVIIAKLFTTTLVPGFAGFCSQYLLTQTVVTTIAYKKSPFRPRDHYLYYLLIFSFGEMLGRSHRLILSKTRWSYTPSTLMLWILSSIEMLVLCFAILESWYRFLPNVGILLFMCFVAGVSQGMLFINMLELLHLKFEGAEREFIMGYAVLPRGLGMFSAALIGLYVEHTLEAHCISMFKDNGFCLTRSNSVLHITSKCLTRHS